MKDKLVVYYKNELKNAASISASPLVSGFEVKDLYHPFLSRRLLFTSTTATIIIKFFEGGTSLTPTYPYPAPKKLDSIILLDTEWSSISVSYSAYFSLGSAGSGTLPNDYLIKSGAHTIIELPEKLFGLPVGGWFAFSITINAPQNISIGGLFIGTKTKFPRFLIKPKTTVTVMSKSETTDNGQVFGLRRPLLETLDVSFQRIDLETRNRMKEYIEDVQFCVPHIIEAYDYDKYNLLYGVLTSAGDFQKRDENGFWFDTALSWKEAK